MSDLSPCEPLIAVSRIRTPPKIQYGAPMQLIVEVSNGMSFEAAFKKIYGIDWKVASPLLAKAVSQQFTI